MKAIYVRCSTLEQTASLQLADIRSVAGMDVKVFSENESAWNNEKKRPEFEKVLDLIKTGKLKELYVWDLDRLYRNRSLLKEFFLLCKIYKCQIHSFRQQWLEQINSIPQPFNEIMHDLMVNIMGWLSEEESEKKSARVKMAIRRTPNGTYSHNNNKWGRASVPTKTRNKVLELHSQGLSLREISNQVRFFPDENPNKKLIAKSTVAKIVNENLLQ